MKLKCPGCSKLLQIPDSAAGKTVKCPCGKQLRVPTPKGSGPAQASRPAAPARRPAPKPTPLGADAGLFDELTETDLAPVAVARQPGLKPVAVSSGGTNPYAASLHDGADSTPAAAGNYASQNKRALNYFLDGIFLPFFMGIGGVIIGLISPLILGSKPNDTQITIYLAIVYLFMLGAFPAYYIIFEYLFGATIGKFITGTRVVTVDGGKPGFGKILVRSFTRMLPFEPLSYFFGDKRLGWHDTFSGTRVIQLYTVRQQ